MTVTDEQLEQAKIAYRDASTYPIVPANHDEALTAAVEAALSAPASHPRDTSTVASHETQSVRDKPVEPEPVAWQHQYRARHLDGSLSDWSEWRDGRAPDFRSGGYQAQERPLFAHPAPTREAIRREAFEEAARLLEARAEDNSGPTRQGENGTAGMMRRVRADWQREDATAIREAGR